MRCPPPPSPPAPSVCIYANLTKFSRIPLPGSNYCHMISVARTKKQNIAQNVASDNIQNLSQEM